MSKLKIVAVLAGLFLIASMLMPSGSSTNVQKLYEEAEQAREEKRYQGAIAKYEEETLADILGKCYQERALRVCR